MVFVNQDTNKNTKTLTKKNLQKHFRLILNQYNWSYGKTSPFKDMFAERLLQLILFFTMNKSLVIVYHQMVPEWCKKSFDHSSIFETCNFQQLLVPQFIYVCSSVYATRMAIIFCQDKREPPVLLRPWFYHVYYEQFCLTSSADRLPTSAPIHPRW